MKKEMIDWLHTQSKDFIEDYFGNQLLGDGEFTLERLAELDEKYNLEGESND